MLNLYANIFGAPIEWFVILGVVLLLFGPKKLPELARSLGKSAGELKKGLDETKEQFSNSMNSQAATDAEKKVDTEVAPVQNPATQTPVPK